VNIRGLQRAGGEWYWHYDFPLIISLLLEVFATIPRRLKILLCPRSDPLANVNTCCSGNPCRHYRHAVLAVSRAFGKHRGTDGVRERTGCTIPFLTRLILYALIANNYGRCFPFRCMIRRFFLRADLFVIIFSLTLFRIVLARIERSTTDG